METARGGRGRGGGRGGERGGGRGGGPRGGPRGGRGGRLIGGGFRGNGGHAGGPNGGRGRGGGGGERDEGGGSGRRGGRGGVVRGAGPQERRPPRAAGFGLIQEKIREKEPDELLLWLLADRGVEALLSSPISLNTRPGILSVVSEGCLRLSAVSEAVRKAAGIGRSPNLTELLIKLRDSPFFGSISEFLVSASMNTGREREEMTRAVSSLISLLNMYMDQIPTDSRSKVLLIITVIETSIVPATNNDNDLRDILALKDEVKEKCQRQPKIIVENKDKKKKGKDEDPPEDFRTISIFPTKQDFEKKPFLRENLIGEAYKNLDTYLDVQFRLNREDFIKPLKDGILDYKEGLKAGVQAGKMRNKDIRVYHDTRFLYPNITPGGVIYTLQFSMEGFKGIRWENSKRLIFGSLVCFSDDDFENFFFGTVKNRDPRGLAEGKIDVSLSTENNNHTEPDRNKSFVMVESSAYFEAYRHVLKSLQDITEDSMPFQQYIVGERKGEVDMFDSDDDEDERQPLIVPEAPRYLDFNTSYDLTPLMRDNCKKLGEKVRVRSSQWPAEDSMAFDKSQLSAVKNALTRELSIVQGPPGTGKTYIGLKIAEVLLLNSEVWNRSRGPILVLCYTNHALDQFLEGILKFHNTEIVRVGSRSKNEVLDNYNLSNLRSEMKKNREGPRDLRVNMSDIYRRLKASEEEMITVTTRVEATTKHVLSENELANAMGMSVYDTLLAGFENYKKDNFVKKRKEKVSVMSEWLGVGKTVEVTEAVRRLNLNGEPQADQAEAVEENIDVVEDAEHEEEMRLLDIDNEQNDALKELKEKRAKALENIDIATRIEDEEVEGGETAEAADRDGVWEITKEERKRRNRRAKQELLKTSIFSANDRANAELILWDLSVKDRWRLYRTWVRVYVDQCQTQWLAEKENYFNCARRLEEVKEMETLHILRSAKVVGMTTTGAARLHSVLKNLKPTIVIVEEAAEVLEAHIVASLTKSCQHLVLIGDHQQLRPNPTVYELCRHYNLDISLFERLIKNGIDYNRLDIQHRMLPAISKLLVPHIYDSLIDHESVRKYPIIKGVSSNMFFIDHDKKEMEIQDGHSKVNDHEVDFLVELCRFLLKQGYRPEQITILTTYSGQLFAFKKKMPRQEFIGVKVSTVDNYQGEENDIILLSLVRSNRENKIGFLAIDNRVCVALSRAKHALYCIGNFVQLCEKSELWRGIMKYVGKAKMCDDGLKLQCQIHPKYSETVKTGAEIKQKFPEGGCMEPCTARLECGHTCQLSCHSYDPRHEEYRCQKECGKVRPGCPENHKCRKRCYEDCGPCQVKVEKIVTSCGHHQMMACSKDPGEFLCREKCRETRACGHKCALLCGVDCSDQTSPATRCMVSIRKKLDCGHVKTVKCYEADRSHVCRAPCEKTLDCGHKCRGNCADCDGARFHVPCVEVCGRPLQCGHTCRETCGLPCLCSQHCQTRCGHSQCRKACAEPCVPCQEACLRQCPHHQCLQLCSEPCDAQLCTEPCPLQLQCGHPCVGVCGEPCPDICSLCNREEFHRLVEDIIFPCEPEDLFIQLSDCRHIIPVESMDHWVKVQQEEGVVKLLECPKCKAPVRTTVRYNGTINRTLQVVERVKEKLRGEESPDSRKKLEKEIKRIVTEEARAVDDKENQPLYSKEQKSEMNEFVKKVLAPEKTITVHHLNNAKLITEWLMIFSRIKLTMRKEKQILIITVSTSKVAGFDLRQWCCEILGGVDKVEKKLELSLLKGTLLTGEEKKNINNEVVRLRNFLQLLQFCRERERKGQSFSLDMKKIIENMKALLMDIWSPFDEKQEKMWKEMALELKKTAGGLGISDTERQEIVQALNMGRGAWYACPNGHPYVIGECHGAMEVSRCNDCGAEIGGTQHRLRGDNTTFGGMDGSAGRDYQWMGHLNR